MAAHTCVRPLGCTNMLCLLFKIKNFVHYNLIKCLRATNADGTSKYNSNLPLGRINIAQAKVVPSEMEGQ